MDFFKKTQGKGITKTQNSNLQKINLTLKEINHLQSLEVLLTKLDPKKMPHPPSHMEKEGEANI
jgi:hypothetical protein